MGSKLLLTDIETMPNLGTFWGLYTHGYINPENIVKERFILAGSCKYVGGSEIRSYSVLTHPGTEEFPDKGVVEALCREYTEADAVIAHNGDKFDVPRVMGRAALCGLPPQAPLTTIDTLKLAKKRWSLNSYRLEYLAEAFHLGVKKTPPFAVWKAALFGDRLAIETIVAYNREDVSPLLENLYKLVSAWNDSKVNGNLVTGERACPRPECGSKRLRSDGYRNTAMIMYRRLQCLDCWHWCKEPVNGKGLPR